MTAENVHRYRFTVLETHLDTFAHMNNAVYLRLFEEARWDWCTAGGFGLKRILENQMGPVILELNLRFRKELKLRDNVTIESRTLETKRAVVLVLQEMKSEAGDVLCEARFTMGFFDMRVRKLMPPPADWLKALSI
jgi:acyl-CoA thioester hydrolase